MPDALDRLPAAERDWLAAIALVEDKPRVPAGADLLHTLADLGVPHVDLDRLLRLRPALDDHDQVRELVDRLLSALLAGLGSRSRLGREPDLGDPGDELLAYWPVYAFAAMAAETRRWHAGRGIDEATTRHTLADLGRQLTHHRRRLGRGGLTDNLGWLADHFQGRLYQLGRLQFELAPLGRTTSAEIRSAGVAAEPGEPVIAVHLPDYCGPIDEPACTESFRAALDFFPRHFPDHPARFFTCHSWLLDPRFAELLPDSNIAAFQRRFTITQRRNRQDDEGPFLFVFGTRDVAGRATLPRHSSLQRAVIDHIDGGGHWYLGAGWRPFAPDA
ncbi:acyltransferase domain-containing protein [Microlunatus parietis]|uniref:Plasmid stabilization system protein ParE n=1 Tax=Microlunatus parietis TaxID=682979 RepID=A0A7Y9I5Y3_9ACTN|nr:acyltransferase domain-containing protein [Microlunatus parietis]NYE70812.1 plasmid stabilization system protein ParE [Microlunatus parietis]